MSSPPDGVTSARSFVTHLVNSFPRDHPPPVTVTADSNTAAAAPTHLLASASQALKKRLLTLHVLFPNEFLPALDLLDRRLVTCLRVRGVPTYAATEGYHDATVTAALRGMPAHSDAEIRGDGMGRFSEVMPIDMSVSANTSADRQTYPFDADTEMREAPGAVAQTRSLQDGNGTGPHAASRREEEEGRNGDVEDDRADTVFYVRSAQQKSSRYNTSYDATTSYEVRLRAWNCSCPAFAFSAFPSASQIYTEDLQNIVGREAMRDCTARQQDDAWTFGGVSLGDGMPPICKHLLACVLVERCGMFSNYVEIRDVDVVEAAGWAAGWGD